VFGHKTFKTHKTFLTRKVANWLLSQPPYGAALQRRPVGSRCLFYYLCFECFSGFVTKKIENFQKKSLFFLTVMKNVVLLQRTNQLIH